MKKVYVNAQWQGGADRSTYDGAEELRKYLPGQSQRRDLYNLYHLLNHLNLFGRSYYGAVMRIVMRY